MIGLEEHLRKRRDSGHKLLVPYITAGAREDWLDIVQAIAGAGADAVEIGIPFSDPVMDGPVIQEASVRALDRGMTPAEALRMTGELSLDIPLAVMTYYNLVFRFGLSHFASALAAAQISGAILPDLPFEEAGEWFDAAESAAVEPVLLVAPNTPDDRLKVIAERSRGFVYAIGVLGVTGERLHLAESSIRTASRVKAVTKKPVLVGVGISTPEQAHIVAEVADGVIIGAAVVRRILDGSTPKEIGELVGSFRQALG